MEPTRDDRRQDARARIDRPIPVAVRRSDAGERRAHVGFVGDLSFGGAQLFLPGPCPPELDLGAPIRVRFDASLDAIVLGVEGSVLRGRVVHVDSDEDRTILGVALDERPGRRQVVARWIAHMLHTDA